MFRLSGLITVLVIGLTACIESPPAPVTMGDVGDVGTNDTGNNITENNIVSNNLNNLEDVGPDVEPDAEQPECSDNVPCPTGVCEGEICIPCLESSCAAVAGYPHCKEAENPLENVCVACLTSEHCDDKVCDPGTNTCVTCVQDNHCPEGKVCTREEDSSLRTCIECRDNSDCPDGQCLTNEQDASQNKCVECVDPSGCLDPSKSLCGTSNTCGGCVTANDCSHLPSTSNYCDPDAGCVHCYGLSEGMDCAGRFCNLDTGICTSTTYGTTPDLHACSSSDECMENSRCMPLFYKSSSHGNYCMPLADPANACPAGYFEKTFRAPVNATKSVLFCRLNESKVTPEAVIEQGSTCGNNSPCSVTLGSTCHQIDVNTNRVCGYECTANSQCPNGSSCKCPFGVECLVSAIKYCL